MTVLVSDSQVREHFSMRQCIDSVERAFSAADSPGFDVTERKVVASGENARLLSLTAASPKMGRLVANIYTGAPKTGDKRQTSVNRRQKLYLLFDAASGACEAIISGAHLAWLKTGAMGAVAIKHLTRTDVTRLAIIGSGRQARAALAGALEVRQFEDIAVWSPNHQHAVQMTSEFTDHIGVRPANSARDAVEGAEVIITATTAKEPVIASEWLDDGFHINSIGAHYPGSREIDGSTIARSRIVVDTLVAARVEKGELMMAEKEGLFSFTEVAGELGEYVSGSKPWQSRVDENTVFASCGSAIESIGAAIGALEAIPDAERLTVDL